MPNKELQESEIALITNSEVKLPDWYIKDLLISFRAGISHTFLLHGDIAGLIPNPQRDDEPDQLYIPSTKFLEKIFSDLDMVIFYNIASGVRFLDPSMEKEFRKIAGLDSEEDSTSKNPVAAAKAGLALKRTIPRDPDSCLALIEKVLKAKPNTAVIIQSVHFIAPATIGGTALLPNERANIERLKNWGQDQEMRSGGNIIFLLTAEAAKVSSELKQDGNEIQTVFIPKPNKEERRAFLGSLIGKNKECRELESQITELQKKLKRARSPDLRTDIEKDISLTQKTLETLQKNPLVFSLPKDFDIGIFAHATQGMSLKQILEMFLHSKKTGKTIDLEYVKDKKREILNNEYGDVLEVVDPVRGLEDIGGLEHVKEYFRDLLEGIRRGEKRMVSRGITIMGPPGTGKTALVEALAKEAGFNFVKTRNARSMWVGESEARREKQIYALKSLAPVVVMNDEADLAEASRDAPKGDSGVSERLMKMWMELLSDPKIHGQIIVISCTNRPDRIDPALKRSGRSDDRILIPMPSFDELVGIFKVMFKRHDIPTQITDFSSFAWKTEGLSGADIENIVLNAFRFAFKKGENFVSEAVLTEAIDDAIPSASQAEIDRMTILGILESSSRRLLPPNIKEIITRIRSRNLIENLNAIIEQIGARNIVEID